MPTDTRTRSISNTARGKSPVAEMITITTVMSDPTPDTVSTLVDLAISSYDNGRPAAGRLLMTQAAEIAARLRRSSMAGWGSRPEVVAT